MDEIILEGRMLSPMYSYGAYQSREGEKPSSGRPEFRASELKGGMRCLYRMAYPGSIRELAAMESELFGGMVGNAGEGQGHASPVQLVIESDCGPCCEEPLLRHKNYRNPVMRRPAEAWKAAITIRHNKRVRRLDNAVGLDWYKDLITLTLLLCGVGKRSRKGRGRVEITGQNFGEEAQALNWICGVLNNLAAAGGKYEDYYRVNGSQIEPKAAGEPEEGRELRPVIQKIRLGEKLHVRAKALGGAAAQSFSCVNGYLWAVDESCHRRKTPEEKTEEEKRMPIDPIGSGRPRFASSLVIGFIRIKKDIYPLYTFVRAVVKRETLRRDKAGRGKPPYDEIDPDCDLREKFICEVMERYG